MNWKGASGKLVRPCDLRNLNKKNVDALRAFDAVCSGDLPGLLAKGWKDLFSGTESYA